jgi:hypothetical protein
MDCLSEVEAVARHDAVTTADGIALASSLQNNDVAEQGSRKY